MELVLLIVILIALYVLFQMLVALVGLIMAYWQIIVLAVFGLIVLRITYHLLIYLPWINRLKKASLLKVKSKNSNKYLIPLKWEKRRDWKYWQLTAVYPYLLNNEVFFAKEMFWADRIECINSRSKQQHLSSFWQQIAIPTQTIYHQVMPQIGELQSQIDELERLKKLACSSDVYRQKVTLYNRAITQLENLYQDFENLRLQSVSYIRELLIGLELSSFDSNSLPDPLEYQLTAQTQYQAISEQLEQLKLEVDAYQSLNLSCYDPSLP